MSVKQKLWAGLIVVIAILAALAAYLRSHNIAILEPQGVTGQKERSLIIIAAILSAIVVIPVYVITVVISLKYREGNRRAKKYRPDHDHNRVLEFTWWGIPIIIIGILSVVAWNSSHQLDPYKALAAPKNTPPLNIQVIALDWKWLFIYPQQNIATVNIAQIPVNTPVAFHVTSDTVMNSFWVPQLGGQIYAMPGMDTQLHLMATKAGSYDGSSANISGKGFAGMTFTVNAGSSSYFNQWLRGVKNQPRQLTQAAYDQLAKPSQNVTPAYYSSVESGLFNDVVMKYMAPPGQLPVMEGM